MTIHQLRFRHIQIIKKIIFAAHILLLFQTRVLAEIWFVKISGNDSNSGKSENSAFQTLQKAAEIVTPGDQVLIGDGNYTTPRQPGGQTLLNITHSGTSNAWIVWKAITGQHPVLITTGWSGILISGSYQILDGLTITGNNDRIFLAEALLDGEKTKPDPYFNSNGIFINGRIKKPDEKPHHIIIRNCNISKCSGGGITIIEADYVSVEDCKVSENAWFMHYGGSGISTLDNWAHDDAPGYHMIIRRNVVSNNMTLVPWNEVGQLSDGNGIILDVTDLADGPKNPNSDATVNAAPDLSEKKLVRPAWNGRSLVANNLCVGSGGSGIHTFRNSHADIVNNTTYWNGGIMGYPEVFANASHDIVFLNNIIVPRPDGKVTSNSNNKNIRWDYNLYPVNQDVFPAANNLIGIPVFLKANTNMENADFHLLKGSPRRGSATYDLPHVANLKGTNRTKSTRLNQGAY